MVMDLGFLYAVVAYVCLAITAAVLGQVFNTKYRETVDKSYVWMLIFMMMFMAVDGTWGLHFSTTVKTNVVAYEVFTYGFHFMAAWSAYVWYGYVIHFARLKGVLKTVFEVFRHLLIVGQMTLLFTNLVNHQFFYFENGVYHPMPLRTVGFVLQFSYYILLMLVTFVMFFVVKDKETRRRFIVASSYSLIPLLFGIGQVIFPDAPMYSLGFVMTAVYIYILNVNKERDVYLESLYRQSNLKLSVLAQGLAYDYKVAYYVDLENNTYECITKDRAYREALDSIKTDNDSTDFFVRYAANITNLVYEEDISNVLEKIDRDVVLSELNENGTYTINYRGIVEGTIKYYRMKFALPKVDGGENKLVIGIYDIDNEIKKELEQQKTLEEALRLANSANAAKTSFLFNMSHDIRTPMNAIFGFTEIARKNIDDKGKVLESLDKIATAGTHLLELINEVLDMSRVESGKIVLNPEKENLIEAGDKIASIIDLAASAKGISIDAQVINLRDPYVMVDKLHFNQIIINVLSNSVKYTNPGGHIDIKLEQLDDDNPEYGRYKFVISDNGVGMSEEFLEEIFEPFSREETATDSGIEGTGLGMSITKRMVDLFKGTIDIQSKKDVGTTTTIILPLKKCVDVANAIDTDEREIENRDIRGLHVLVAEDNALNREIVEEFLNELGVTADYASNGIEALEMHKTSTPGKYKAILMDVQMPKMGGYEATAAIRSLLNDELASVPIIAMTANAFAEDKERAYEVGMDAHVAKPISIEVLKKTLQQYAL